MQELISRFRVEGKHASREVICGICGARVKISILPHLRNFHPGFWNELLNWMIELHSQGLGPKGIMGRLSVGGEPLFSWSVIKRELISHGLLIPRSRSQLEFVDLEPRDFKLETSSIWSFPTRAEWAVHSPEFPGNWSPYIPRNLILKFTKEGDWVLDPFLGGGTTLIECILLNRNGIGVDISPLAVKFAKAKLDQLYRLLKLKGIAPRSIIRLHQGDSTRLEELDIPVEHDSIELICAHPPYWDIIHYSDHPRDLSNASSLKHYLELISQFRDQAYRALKRNGILGLLIGDLRKSKQLIPLGFEVYRVFKSKFKIHDIAIKIQHSCSHDMFWRKRVAEEGILRIEHEYLLILRK